MCTHTLHDIKDTRGESALVSDCLSPLSDCTDLRKAWSCPGLPRTWWCSAWSSAGPAPGPAAPRYPPPASGRHSDGFIYTIYYTIGRPPGQTLAITLMVCVRRTGAWYQSIPALRVRAELRSNGMSIYIYRLYSVKTNIFQNAFFWYFFIKNDLSRVDLIIKMVLEFLSNL